MFNILLFLLVTVSLVIVVLILLQPSKQSDPLSLLLGDKESILFMKQKLRGYNQFLQYCTAFLGIIWLVLSISLMYLEN